MNAGATLANAVWLAGSAAAYRRFGHGLGRPRETQRRLLQRLVERHADSAYGRAHRFDKIGSAEEFLRRVPMTTYDGLEPWIERVRAGEPGVLTVDPVTRLVPTSGSSGARKLIPFTAGLRAEFNAAIAAWVFDLWRQRTDIAGGPAYWSVTPSGAGGFGGADDGKHDGPGACGVTVPVGFDDDNEYVGAWAKRWVERAMAAPSVLGRVRNVETFRFLVLRCLLGQRELRLISVWHPSYLTLLLDALPEHWAELLTDIREGGCGRAAGLPEEVRAALRFAPDPKRAAELARGDAARPETLWPRVGAISCWGDGHAAPAVEEVRRRFPRALIQPKGLLATEAVVTIPFRGLYPVAVTSHFFEFIDEEGVLRGAEALHPGKVYEVVVTTGGGLWRYRLGDRVEVDGFVGDTPSLRFLGRAGGVSDRRGEKLAEEFVGAVIAEVARERGAAFRFAMLAPDGPEEAAGVGGCWYTLYVDGPGGGGGTGAWAVGVADRLEEKLRRNPHYAHCRDLRQLLPLRVFVIEADGYEAFVGAEFARGKRLGEIKPCALSTRTDWSARFVGKYVE